MGDGGKTPLRLRFNPKIRLEFRGATITSDAGLLAFRSIRGPVVDHFLYLHRNAEELEGERLVGVQLFDIPSLPSNIAYLSWQPTHHQVVQYLL
jgi:hypothetical protein